MTPTVSIIIVNWNGRRFLRTCLESIRDTVPPISYEVIVVDNGSTDGSLAEFEQLAPAFKFEGFRLISNTENRGFSAANNQAMKVARGKYIFLLNTDTELRRHAVQALILALDRDPTIGICGPRLLNTDGSLQPSAFHCPLQPWQVFLKDLHLHRFIPRKQRPRLLLGMFWDHRAAWDVGYLTGAALIARRAVIDSIGGLDERYSFYGEDSEWCWRARSRGWRVVLEPGAEVVHHGGGSAIHRWGEMQAVVLKAEEAWLELEWRTLPLWHAATNLLVRWTANVGHQAWRKLKRRRRDSFSDVLDQRARLFRTALLRMLRAPNVTAVIRGDLTANCRESR